MKNMKKLLALLLAIVMVMGMLPVTAGAETTWDHTKASYDLSFDDERAGKGALVDDTPDEIASGDKFKVTLTWDTADYISGGTVIYRTNPGFILYDDEFKINNYEGADVTDNAGVKNGSFDFGYDATTKSSFIKITFDKAYADTAAGTLTLYGKFEDPEDADTDNDGNVEIPNPEEEYPIWTPPVADKTYEVNVTKEGERKSVNGKVIIHYVVAVSAPDGKLSNVVVTDTPDDAVTILTDSVYLANSSYATNGTPLETTEGTSDYWTQQPTYSWTISEIPDEGTVYIHYDAEVTNFNSTKVRNSVEVSAGDKSDNASCEVSLEAPNVTKSGNKTGNKVTWTISVTFNDFDTVKLTEAGDTIKEEVKALNENATFTVTYYPGNRTVTGNLKGWLNQTGEYSDGLVLTREGTETSAVVTFDMLIPESWGDTNTEFENTVWYEYGGDSSHNTGDKVPVTQTPRINGKTGTDLAYNHTKIVETSTNQWGQTVEKTILSAGGKPEIQWEVNFSFGAPPYELYKGNPRFGDVILNTYNESSEEIILDVQYVRDSFELYLEGNKVNWDDHIKRLDIITIEKNDDPDNMFFHDFQYTGIGWSFTTYENGMRAFILEFSESAPAGNYTLKYKTSYDPTKLSGRPSYTVQNAFFANNFEYKKASAEVILQYIRKSASEPDNSGVQNVTDANVNWYISFEPIDSERWIDFSNDDPLVITDTLPEGFNVKSVKLIYQDRDEETYETEERVETVVEHTPDEYGYSPSPNLYYQVNGNQMVITIGKDQIFDRRGMLKYGMYLEIATEYQDFEKLAPGKTSKVFTNTANIKVNGTTYTDVTADVTITPPPLITKAITYNNLTAPRPKFEIVVNPKAEDLMKDSENITIQDIIVSETNEEPKQNFLPDTLEVYEGTGTGKTLVAKENYTVTVNDAKTEFTIKGLKDRTTYTINYRTKVNVPYDHTGNFHLINQVYLKDVYRNMDEDADLEEVFVELDWFGQVVRPSAINQLNIYKPQVMVMKTDSGTGAPLAGAVFEIKDDKGTVVATLTSNADGETGTYQLIDNTQFNRTYTMKEIKAPTGYTLSNQEWKFGRYTTGNNCPSGVTNIDGKALYTYEITNTPEQTGPVTGSLKVTKTVIGENAPADDVFTFTLATTIEGADLSNYTYKIGENGEEKPLGAGGTFQLKHGETAIFSDILAGEYTITETANADYDCNFPNGTTVEVPADGEATAAFTNTYKRTTLSVTKTVSGNAPAGDEFTFTISGGDLTGVKYKIGNGAEQDLVDGKFTLKGGETITFTNILKGTYTITEAANEDYQSSWNNNSITVTVSDAQTVTCTNTYIRTSLTIKKDGGATGEAFLMTLTGTDGTSLQIMVPANDAVVVNGLKIGDTYTVTEDATWAKRYTITNPAAITLEETGNEVTVTNTLNVKKWLYGDSYCENRWNADGNVAEIRETN